MMQKMANWFCSLHPLSVVALSIVSISILTGVLYLIFILPTLNL